MNRYIVNINKFNESNIKYTAIRDNTASFSSKGLVPNFHKFNSFSVFSLSSSQSGRYKDTSVITGRGVVGG